VPDSNQTATDAMMARVAESLRADLDRRWMEAITLGPAQSDFDRQCYTRTVSGNMTPSKALDISTLMQTIDEFEERYHRKDVEMFAGMFACGVMVVCDPNLDGDQMVLRVGSGRDRAVREAMNAHFDKAVRK
jgi:hypothetical protein